jgi:peptidoglycan L-alanyl-D-glutamate endopeptidase CwlK
VTLLDALGAIDRHPLQQWARARYALYKDALARSEAAFRVQQEAAQAKEGAERDAATLKADIEKLNADIALTPDDAAAREHLHTQIIAKSEELGRINGRLSLAVLRFEATQTTVTQVQQPLASQTILSPVAGQAAVPSQPSADVALADAITAISQKVTASWLSHYFPPAAAANIENAAPFLQAALQEFKVADKRMVAAIIATVAVETPRFEAYEEPASAAAKYDGKLGNTQEGDGIRYRGRGYLGITGRSNYESMSSRLGLGTRLLNSPDDAKSPEVATRILVAWFIDRQDRLIPALAQSDLSQVRWVVVGSRTRDIERFTEVYRKVLTDL